MVIFGLPEDGYDPPALSVVHQLNAVNAPNEWLFVFGIVASFVRAEDVSDLPERSSTVAVQVSESALDC